MKKYTVKITDKTGADFENLCRIKNVKCSDTLREMVELWVGVENTKLMRLCRPKEETKA